MEKYNYYKAVEEDVIQGIADYYDNDIAKCKSAIEEDKERLKVYFIDLFWNDDSITGNASGSYTFNSYKASEYIAFNLDLYQEATACFETDLKNPHALEPETIDVTIRCYLLSGIVCSVIDNIEEGSITF